MDNVTIGLALVAGILSFISPCVLPLVPAYIGYMGGRLTHNVSRQSAAGAATTISLAMRLQMLLHGIAFVLGFTIVFVLIGLFTTALSSLAGQHVSTFTEMLGRIGGVVIIFFGFQFMGVMPRFFAWLRKKEQAGIVENILFSLGFAVLASGLIYWAVLEQATVALPFIAALLVAMFISGAFTEPAAFWHGLLERLESLLYSDTRGDIGGSGREGLLGSTFMGMVFSAGWTPCIGPLLGTILTVAAASGATSGDIAQGMLLLAAYSIGLGIPFVITALLMNGAQGILRRLQRHMHKIELLSGTLLILIGLLVASGQLQSLSQTFSQGEFADFTFRVEECGVGFFEGQLNASHLGACLSGSLFPVAINQSASGRFAPDLPQQEYLFHAEAGRIIDFEVRSVNDEAPPFEMILYGPGDAELARADKAGSLESDGRLFPLVGFTLEDDGLYRVVLRSAAAADSARFRVKARDAEAFETAPANAPSRQIETSAGEAAPTGGAMNSLADIAGDLEPAVGLTEGKRAPAFSVETLDDVTVKLSDLRDRVVLLNFWGTWCGPCRREMPEFQKAYEEWHARGFEILAIAYNDTEAAMASFRDEFGLSFPLALDESGDVNEAYAIQTRPSSYLLGKDGVILARHFGIMTEAQLSELLHEALA
ncbi:MAG: redoxin domain-containing protein [Chloroflexota bacterium]|nr:redoxin domain-containing protein [Chloroflexota bacterium]MDE2948290.1 redoxin domain-containing protein [Chloroflexota bacterium]